MPRACCIDTPGDYAVRLLEGLREALVECEAPACRVSLVPGVEAAFDVCCECCAEDGTPADGQAWVRLDSVYPSDALPNQLFDPEKCGHGWAARYELGIVRCMHTVNDDGTPPCADDLNGDALKVSRDANIMRQAVLCHFGPSLDPQDCSTYLIGEWSPRGVSGGCGGGTLVVDVAFNGHRCLPDE